MTLHSSSRCAACVGALLLCSAPLTSAHGATYTVTTLADSGKGSLRAAIMHANGASNPDTIRFASSLRGTLSLKSPLPDLNGSLSLIGPGRERLNVRRNGISRYRIFTITKNGHVSLSGLTLSNGFAQATGKNDPKNGDGGGIHNEGILQMTNCSLIGNQSSGNGGGIFNTGPQLTLTNCLVTDNACLLTKPEFAPAFGGGGLFNLRDDVALVITDCTFSRNVCRNDGDGGAIKNASHAMVRILRSTLTQNTATRSGGALDATADVEYGGGFDVTDSLIAGNTAGDGGAISTAQYSDTVSLTGCTVSGNKATEMCGAIHAGWGGLTLKKCTITGNIAPKNAGIRTCVMSSISQCIIAGNRLPSHAPSTDIELWDPKVTKQLHPSGGGNLIGQGDATTLGYFQQKGDKCNVSPADLKLGTLTKARLSQKSAATP